MPIGKMMSDSEVFEQERKTLRQLLKQLWVFRHLSAEDFRSLLFRFEKEEIQCASKRYSMRMEEGAYAPAVGFLVGRYTAVVREAARQMEMHFPILST